MVLNALEYNSR